MTDPFGLTRREHLLAAADRLDVDDLDVVILVARRLARIEPGAIEDADWRGAQAAKRIVDVLREPQPAAGPWIAVADRLPESDRCVLAWDADDGERVAQRMPVSGGDEWVSSDGGELRLVTHWAEIAPPMEEIDR